MTDRSDRVETGNLGRARASALTSWFEANGRTFMWRRTNDDWVVFLSEFLLRRTKAEQISSLLPDVLTHFPVPADLARASEEDVQLVFRSAGLRDRIRQLHATADLIASVYDNEVPTEPDDLEALPGVGPYVAHAVAARLAGRNVELIDTNTVRVATRVLGVQPTTKEPRRERAVMNAVGNLFGGPAPAELWWAVIDLAHLICRPKDPECKSCPLVDYCEFAANRSQI